ncbi:MAG: hypothetical protein COA57_07735 [Flavobacteriales bacterium]|nr:MAG: hypothetical protein COA57_07735 [Flavobacteriales bacterium]
MYGKTDFYDRGNAVSQCRDGGYIIVGRTVNFKSKRGVDAYLVRTNALGDTIWTKTIGDKGSEEAYSVQQTADDGFIITGFSDSYGSGSLDVYLIKTNAKGDPEWTKAYGGSEVDRGYSVQQCADGGYIITGETYSFGNGGVNAYLIRTNAKGDTLWTKVFGGNGIEEGRSVQETTDGGYVITGATNSFGAGDYDIYLIRTDNEGEMVWTKTFGGSGTEKGYSVFETEDKGFVIAGNTESYGMGGSDIYLIRTGANGIEFWSKTYGGKNDEYGHSVQQIADGGVIIAGYTNSKGAGGKDVYLVRTDENGDVIWERTYGSDSDECGKSVQQTSDGGFAVAGNKITMSSSGIDAEKIKDIFLIKTDAKGDSQE